MLCLTRAYSSFPEESGKSNTAARWGNSPYRSVLSPSSQPLLAVLYHNRGKRKRQGTGKKGLFHIANHDKIIALHKHYTEMSAEDAFLPPGSLI